MSEHCGKKKNGSFRENNPNALDITTLWVQKSCSFLLGHGQKQCWQPYTDTHTKKTMFTLLIFSWLPCTTTSRTSKLSWNKPHCQVRDQPAPPSKTNLGMPPKQHTIFLFCFSYNFGLEMKRRAKKKLSAYPSATILVCISMYIL